MNDPRSRITVRIAKAELVFQGGLWKGGNEDQRWVLGTLTKNAGRHDTAEQIVARALKELGIGSIIQKAIVRPVEDLALGVG